MQSLKRDWWSIFFLSWPYSINVLIPGIRFSVTPVLKFLVLPTVSFVLCGQGCLMGKSECYAALLKGNANRNIILKKYKWGEKPLERSIWVSRVAAVSRKGVSCRALTSTVGSQPSLQERSELWCSLAEAWTWAVCAFCSPSSSHSPAVAKHFVRECNWPWNVLWARRTNWRALGDLLIASCCLFLSLNLIPFKLLFWKSLGLIWNKERWQFWSSWVGEQGCLQALWTPGLCLRRAGCRTSFCWFCWSNFIRHLHFCFELETSAAVLPCLFMLRHRKWTECASEMAACLYNLCEFGDGIGAQCSLAERQMLKLSACDGDPYL